MSSLTETQGGQGKTYWRSLNDLADTEEFREMVSKEFPSQLDAVVDPVSRRRFVQLMGASLALAGLTGCDIMRWPEERVLPYSRLPDERLPGEVVHYATTMELGGVGYGLEARSYDGRPIKVEGNSLHPESLGATKGFAQASVLGLYDPDRSTQVRRKGEEAPSTWAAFDKDLAAKMTAAKANQGAKVAVLSEASSSVTLESLRAQLAAKGLSKISWHEWEPISRDNEITGVAEQFMGGRFRAQLDLKNADVILSLDDDLFEEHPASLRLAREWADRRRGMDAGEGVVVNRLYMVESVFSPTGSMADVRQPLPPSHVLPFALHLAGKLAQHPDMEGKTNEALRKKLAPFAGEKAPHAELVDQLVKDLVGAGSRSVVSAGPRQPSLVHALAQLINELLGAPGTTVTYTPAPAAKEDLASLRTKIDGGAIDTLIVIGANPAYDAPVGIDFAKSLQKSGLWSAHLGLYHDETGQLTTWHLPRAHYLESWGDARSWDGTVSLCQPLIAPLYSGRTAIELVAGMAGLSGKAATGYELVRATLLKGLGKDPESGWRRALHDGILADSAPEAKARINKAPGPLLDAIPAAKDSSTSPNAQSLELVFTPCSKLYDGRFANNGWLQELPEPFTKLTWDNAVLVSPETASKDNGLGLAEGDLVTLTVQAGGGSKTLQAPVFVLPGLPAHTLNLALGYGRKACGVVGKDVGANAYTLRGAANLGFVGGVTLAKLNSKYELATTQDHHSVRSEVSDKEVKVRTQELVHEGSLAAYEKSPTSFRNVWESADKDGDGVGDSHYGVGPDPSKIMLWKEPQTFEGRKWGMAIDLSVCTGCSSCVVACQAENNIPVVGKSEVKRGREMHWLRIDRYFSEAPLVHAGDHGKDAHGGHHGKDEHGKKDAKDAGLPAFLSGVRVVHQPMPCQQCENAPCESVCPVAATTHSAEGLNDMVYNRCIGTRYCSNNCPWKVRRFNYFWNHHGPFHPRSEPGPSTLPKFPKSKITDTLKVLPTAAETAKVETMAFNPEVTVRARGVMEKCTYCVQRIKAVTIPERNKAVRAKQKTWKVPDGAIKTACQQVCPTQAITFGDLSDPDSAVSRLRNGDRSYTMLPELNARPRTSYLALIRNLPTV